MVNNRLVYRNNNTFPLSAEEIDDNFEYLARTVELVSYYGAVGDGVTDDTAAIQAALNAATRTSSVELVPGKTYAVTNLTLPVPTSGDSYNWGPYFGCPGGYATLKRIAGGDTAYMVASSRWPTGAASSTSSNSPWVIEGIIFDGDDICNNLLVLKSFSTHVRNNVFVNALDTGLLFTRQNQDGTTASTGYMSGTRIWRNRFQDCDLYGFRTQGEAVATSDGPSDGTFSDNLVHECGTGIYLVNCGGWQVTGNRTHTMTTRAAVFEQLSRGHLISDNNWDGTGGVLIGGTTNPLYSAVIGPGNSYYEPLFIDFRDDTTEEAIYVKGEAFFAEQNGTEAAYIEHRNNRDVKRIVCEGNTFLTDDPYRRASGNTLGRFTIASDLSVTTSNRPVVPERSLATSSFAALVPIPNAAAPTVIGTATSVTGTGTARANATTNLYTSTKRLSYVTAASADAAAGVRMTSPMWWRGNAAGLGGFETVITFGINTYAAGLRLFAGLTNNVVVGSGADPSAMINTIGVGKDAADTTLQIMHNDGSGVATKVDLGVQFPANTSATDLYRLTLKCVPNGSTVYYEVRRLNTGDTATGSIATNLPSSTAFLGPQVWINTGAGAGAVDVDLFAMQIQAIN